MSSMPAPKPDIHVLIIGTGITGLVLAHGLQQVGVFYNVPIPKKKPRILHLTYITTPSHTARLEFASPSLKGNLRITDHQGTGR